MIFHSALPYTVADREVLGSRRELDQNSSTVSVTKYSEVARRKIECGNRNWLKGYYYYIIIIFHT